MPEARKCSSCGTELPANVSAAGEAMADKPSSLCPACMLSSTVRDVQPAPQAGPAGTIVLPMPLTEQPGDTIGRYKLLAQIGEGGFGVVYVADQEEPIRRRVALKVIKLGMDTKEVIARFEAERQALALMDHTNIAKVFDAGATASGRPFFVMEWVKGERITDYCDKDTLTMRQRLDLFVQICHAVQHAHQKGIIHRDIKPNNILVTLHDGELIPKVIDFGIAKATEQRLTDKTIYTSMEQIIGTPAYMSPEQAEMTGMDIDTRSDIYSLGVLLYELLTGTTPFDAKKLLAKGIDEMRRAIREEEPQRPSTRLATMAEGDLTTTARRRQTDAPKLLHMVRGDLDWIVMKCLEKERAGRYETANGLAFDLLRHLNNEPVLARPPSKIYRLQKMVRRNKLAFAAGTAVASAVLAGLALATFLFIGERKARERASEAENVAKYALQQQDALLKQTQAAKKKAELAAERERDSANAVKMTLAAADFSKAIDLIAQEDWSGALAYLARSLSNNPTNEAASTRLATLLASHVWEVSMTRLSDATNISSVQFSPDGGRILAILSDQAIRQWDAQTGQPLTDPWKLAVSGIQSPSKVSANFSPDGKRIVTVSLDNILQLWDEHNGQPLTLPLEERDLVTSAQFSPDSKRLVTTSWPDTARVWDAQSGQPLTDSWKLDAGELNYGYNLTNSAQFSPDGTRIVMVSSAKAVRVWNALNGQPLTGPWKLGVVRSVQFSPDGKRIVIASDDAAQERDAQNGEILIGFFSHGGAVNSAQFSPDGKRIVTASADHTARIWDAQTGLPLTAPLPCGASVLWAQFSPDGEEVLTVSSEHAARVWNARSGRPLTDSLKHSASVLSAQFSPDGRRVVTVSSDHTAGVWNVQDGDQLTEPLFHHDRLTSAQFNPDGTRIVTASSDNTARVWNAQNGQPLTAPLEHDGIVSSAQFSPDGQRIVTASLDHTARVWDAQSGQPVGMPLKHDGAVSSAQISPDGKSILTSSLNAARLWDAQTGLPLAEPLKHGATVVSAQFSPDGQQIVTASEDHTACVWDAHNGRPMTPPLQHNETVLSAQFSPDGKRIVTASWDKTARVWDAETGQPLTEPLKHKEPVVCAQFSPDGKRIVTASADGARVWDAQSGQPLTEPLQCDTNISSAQFSPNGERILTASLDGTARVWDIAPSGASHPDWLLQLAEVISGKELNKQGLLEPTKLNRGDFLDQLRRRLSEKPDDGQWVHWGRWLLADPATRTISPFCKMSVPEYIENRIMANTLASLAEANWLALGKPELCQTIAQARVALEQSLAIKSRAAALKEEAFKLAAQGQWQEAATNYAKSVELAPEGYDSKASFDLSALLAHNGDLDGYRQNCARALSRFGATKDWQDAEAVVQACLFLPASGIDLTEVGRLAQTAAMCPTNDIDIVYCQFAKGLADFRQGHFSSASDWIQKMWTRGGMGEGLAQGWLVLAMSQFQMGQTNEARSSFFNGWVITETELPKPEAGGMDTNWNNRIETDLLLKEATRTLAGQPAGANFTQWISLVRTWRADQVEAEALAARGNLALAETKYVEAAELNRKVWPADPAKWVGSLAALADLHARAGRWKDAAGEYAKALEAPPENDLPYYSLATLYVQSGDLDGYRRVCAQALTRFGDTKQAAVQGRLAKDCLIVAGSGLDLRAVENLVDAAVMAPSGDPNLPWCQFDKGLAEYRQGRFSSAADWEQKVLQPGTDDVRDAEAWLVLAMAQCQMTRTEEARNALAKGAGIIEAKLPKLESGDIGADWRNWIIARALAKEARDLIEGQTIAK